MAHDVIKLDYPKAEEMCKTFKASVQQIEATIKEMTAIANTLQEGALLGAGGTAYVDAIRTNLLGSLKKLREKYVDLDKDVAAAVKAMQEQDQNVVKRMG